METPVKVLKLSVRARNSLSIAKIETIEDLREVLGSENNHLRMVIGCGPVTMSEITAALNLYDRACSSPAATGLEMATFALDILLNKNLTGELEICEAARQVVLRYLSMT